ncbi:Putative Chromo-like domain superfamily protein [Septoria linicola]|uniref:Chromo-like domain superfamily protein n=1 Tax=Septoria linicola TaxID=215465 RepID=A0A9Q9B0G1_9PEZI|nr:putative Chromo-like domain superfamily protein [Septoria linicola]USW55348.1 Putative Chromo-like domain superfamily protein [Septoria linicola]
MGAKPIEESEVDAPRGAQTHRITKQKQKQKQEQEQEPATRARRYKGSKGKAASSKYPRPGPDEHGLYAIDGIIDATYDGLTEESCERWQYLVTWTGYPKSEAQWVTQYYAGAWYIEEYWQKQNAEFERAKEEFLTSENFLTSVVAANKWSRDSERSAFWTWLERKEQEDQRVE